MTVGQGPFPEVKRRKGSRAAGQRLERNVVAELQYLGIGAVLSGQWIEYHDANGRGWAQPDAIVLANDGVSGIVFECKLKRTLDADIQLRDVYLPLVAHIWPQRKWRCVAVCQYWAGSIEGLRVVTTFDKVLQINEPLIWWHRFK